MASIQDYKCPCCGGAIEFNSTVQKMKCPYCESEFELSAVASYQEELQGEGSDNMEWDNSATQEWTEGDTEGARVYVCESCGGQIIADENTAASKCPYCDNPIVFKGSVAGALKPDVIIPFKLNKEKAKEQYKKHLEGKKFLPQVFKSENHIDEIRPIYVPYWLFDAKADARIRYTGIKTRRYTQGEYECTEKKYYSVVREGDIAFAHVPVDGSEKMPDDLMESIEPFDFKDTTEFRMEYLAGSVADKYDQTAEQVEPRANERIKKSTEVEFRKTVKGYDTVTCDNSNINLQDGKSSYAMYPVYILNTTWNNQKFLFAMNGQTGKFVGNLPLDKAAANKALLIRTAILTPIFFVICLLCKFYEDNLSNPYVVWAIASLIISFILSLIVNSAIISKLKSVRPNNQAAEYIVQGSMHVTRQTDNYLYTKVDRVRRQTNNK